MARWRPLYLLLHLGWVCALALAQECHTGGLPVACSPPPAANIVSGLIPIASNTCGLNGPERVCYRLAAGGDPCDYCDAAVPELAHLPEYITDPHSSFNQTYWQSQNYSVVQYPATVVITFPLNKTFSITRVAITFQSSRPESYSIFKSADNGESFTPFQYYSLSCEATFGVDEGTAVAEGEEDVALCTSQEAQPTPLSGGEAVFQPLDHRPSAHQFATNAQLQDWVQATHLQLRLHRLNTFSDTSPTDPEVLDSYFYAISNVEVSGQCFCNGHASSCSGSPSEGIVCDCEHNTAGPDCGECLPFYQDKPWSPATVDNPATCAACNCHNHSSKCHFDEDLYIASGNVSGGVCEECGDNTEGTQCERCRLGYHPNPDVPFTSPVACIPCPACYNLVAAEFNTTLTRFSHLLSELNTSMAANGGLPPDLLTELQNYLVIVEEMLQRAQNLTNQERELTLSVARVTMDTDGLEDVIGLLAENVSLAEEGLAQLTAQSGPASQLLGQLQTTLGAVEEAVRVQLVASLTRAHNHLLTIETQFASLVSLSKMANETSVAQYELALSLLSSITNASTTAQQALELLAQAISLQNETTAAIATLDEIDSSFQAVMGGLREAEVTVPLALSRARAILHRIRNISLESYDVTSLEARLEDLREMTEALVSKTASASEELDQVEEEVAGVRQEASQLVAESTRLNTLAVELLGRAHAAFSFATQTVESGNDFVAMVEQLLVDLQERLANSRGFVSGLEEVIQNVMEAEDLVGEAEEEGERKRDEVNQAARNLEQAVKAIEEASGVIGQALEAALSVNGRARGVLVGATLLRRDSEELAANVSESEGRLAELEGVALTDAGVISMTTETAQTAINATTTLKGDIQVLLGVLEDLQRELNTTDLLPGDRLSEVGSMVTQLESQADDNQHIINTLQDQVGQLEASAGELRERHTSLQQHRDLLQSILDNVEQLDCRNQFQSFS